MGYPFFSDDELRCKCRKCNGQMNPTFMAKLVQLRSELGQPMHLSSAYRCPEYNALVSHTGTDGPHTTGRAVDIQCYGNLAYSIISFAEKYGITGIGISQKGDRKSRFIHIDDLEGNTRPWVWSY